MKTIPFFLLLSLSLLACQPDRSEQALLQPLDTSSFESESRSPVFALALKTGVCITGGNWAKVYDPDDPNPDIFAQAPYHVKWIQEGQVIGEGNHLKACACGAVIKVQVTDLVTGRFRTTRFTPSRCIHTQSDGPRFENEPIR